MNIGKARALFEQVASGEYHGSTVGEYLEAVKIILDMETHNSISKKMIISVCKWLVEIAEKAVSPYRWIPVSERLPEPRIDVWVNSDLGQMTGYYDETIELWYGRDYLELIVNAWMPLPEPYQKGAKD